MIVDMLFIDTSIDNKYLKRCTLFLVIEAKEPEPVLICVDVWEWEHQISIISGGFFSRDWLSIK